MNDLNKHPQGSLRPEEAKLDDFFRGQLSCYQPRHGLRSGLDTIILAASIEAIHGQRLLEIGAGSGVCSLAVALRVAGISVTGIETEPELVELFKRNVDVNRGRVAEGNSSVIVEAGDWLASEVMDAGTFDHVFANPPYDIEGEVREPKMDLLRSARVISRCGLALWVSRMVDATRKGGTVTIIHRPRNLELIKNAMGNRLGGMVIKPIVTRVGDAASRILVSGVVGSLAPVTFEPELNIYDPNGEYRPSIAMILGSPVALRDAELGSLATQGSRTG